MLDMAGLGPPMRRPIFSKLASAIGSGFDSSPLCMTAIASEISNSSSRSWLMTSTAEPLRASSMSAWRMCAAAPASTPQVGWLTTMTLGLRSSSRPTMNFCRLPPDNAAASGSGALLRTSMTSMMRWEAA